MRAALDREEELARSIAGYSPRANGTAVQAASTSGDSQSGSNTFSIIVSTLYYLILIVHKL